MTNRNPRYTISYLLCIESIVIVKSIGWDFKGKIHIGVPWAQKVSFTKCLSVCSDKEKDYAIDFHLICYKHINWASLDSQKGFFLKKQSPFDYILFKWVLCFYKTVLYYNIAYIMCTNQEKNCFEVLTGISVLESPELKRGYLPNVYFYVCLSGCMQRYRLLNKFPPNKQDTYHCKSIQNPAQNGQEGQWGRRWAEIEYCINAFCFDLYICNHHQFLHKKSRSERGRGSLCQFLIRFVCFYWYHRDHSLMCC